MENKKLSIEEMCREFDQLIFFEIWKHLKKFDDVSLVEDCAQEVMIKMYKEYDKLSAMEHDAQAVYIGKMTFGIAVNFFNREIWLRNHVIPFENLDELAEAQYAMADIVIASEVRESIADLSDVDREIIELFYYLGYTHKEISSILCISEANSRQRLRRAKINLRKRLELNRKIQDRI